MLNVKDNVPGIHIKSFQIMLTQEMFQPYISNYKNYYLINKIKRNNYKSKSKKFKKILKKLKVIKISINFKIKNK